MTFLHTFFLTALAAAALPILFHLLSRYRLPLVRFSSLEFLQRLQKKKARRIRLRQLILLVIRTLAVIAVVLVFARPAMQTGKSAGSAAAVEIVIVIDDCLNSTAETRNGQLLRMTIREALEIIDLSGSHDVITLVRTSDPRSSMTVPSNQSDLLRNRLEEIEPRYWQPELTDVEFQVDSIFNATDKFNRELYLISSFYSPGWDSVRWAPPDDTERRFIIPIGQDRLENLSIDRVTIQSTIKHRGRPVDIEAEFRNHSAQSVTDALVGIYLEKERVALASIDIPADGVTTQTFTLTPENSGKLSGMCKLEDIDPLTADNRHYFILDVPDSLSVLVIAADTVSRQVLRAAFVGEASDFIHIEWGDPRRWEAGSLAGYDCLLLAGVRSVSSGAAGRIREFAQQGGGVIIFQGRNTDLAALGRGLWRELGFSGARGTIESEDIGWGKVDLSHPLFSGMFEKDGSPRSPLINFAIDLTLSRDDQVIIPLSNGRPFLVERSVGRGRALMFAVPASVEAGNFVYTGIFAPLIYRSVGYVTSGFGDDVLVWQTGRSYRIILSLPRSIAVRMTTPADEIVDLPPRPVVGGVEFDVGRVALPGIYRLTDEKRMVASYAANIPKSESTLIRRDIKSLSSELGKAIIIDTNQPDLAGFVYSHRFGRELWKPLVAIFLVLLVAESIIGRSGGRSREG